MYYNCLGKRDPVLNSFSSFTGKRSAPQALESFSSFTGKRPDPVLDSFSSFTGKRSDPNILDSFSGFTGKRDLDSLNSFSSFTGKRSPSRSGQPKSFSNFYQKKSSSEEFGRDPLDMGLFSSFYAKRANGKWIR